MPLLLSSPCDPLNSRFCVAWMVRTPAEWPLAVWVQVSSRVAGLDLSACRRPLGEREQERK